MSRTRTQSIGERRYSSPGSAECRLPETFTGGQGGGKGITLSRRSDERTQGETCTKFHPLSLSRALSSRCAKSPRDIVSRVALKNLNAAFGLAGAKFKLNRRSRRDTARAGRPEEGEKGEGFGRYIKRRLTWVGGDEPCVRIPERNTCKL